MVLASFHIGKKTLWVASAPWVGKLETVSEGAHWKRDIRTQRAISLIWTKIIKINLQIQNKKMKQSQRT